MYLILAERPLSYVPYTNIQPSIYREHGGVKIKRGEEERKKKKKKEIRDGRPGVRVVEEGFTKVNAANNRRGRMDARVEPEEARG